MKESTAIKSLRVEGLHGRQTIELEFKPTLNIIHGRNGTGKTTLLHIITNLSDGDIERFLKLVFHKIYLRFFSGSIIELHRYTNADGILMVAAKINDEVVDTVTAGKDSANFANEDIANLFYERPTYLPAFRSVLDAVKKETTHEWQYSSRSENEIDALRTGLPENYVPAPMRVGEWVIDSIVGRDVAQGGGEAPARSGGPPNDRRCSAANFAGGW